MTIKAKKGSQSQNNLFIEIPSSISLCRFCTSSNMTTIFNHINEFQAYATHLSLKKKVTENVTEKNKKYEHIRAMSIQLPYIRKYTRSLR